MGFLPMGGFIFSIDGGNYIGTERAIRVDTFEQIAKILDIPKADRDRLMARKPRSVFVYRGTPVKEAPFVTVAGRRGGASRGKGGGGRGGKR